MPKNKLPRPVMKSIYVRLPDIIHAYISTEADTAGINVSEYIRSVLVDKFRKTMEAEK